MGLKQGAQFSGQSEGHQEIRNGQQFGVLASDPIGGVLMATLGTGSTVARLTSELGPSWSQQVAAAVGKVRLIESIRYPKPGP